MSYKAVMLSAILCLPVASASASNGELPIDGVRLASPSPYVSARSGAVWTDTLVRLEASSLSVYIQNLDLASGDYLRIDNGVDEQLFTSTDGEGFWTDALAGNTLRITLFSARGHRGEGVVIDRYRADYTPDPTSSIYKRNNLLPIADAPEDVYLQREATARVYMAGVGYCTGFMISRDLMMTNNHCVDSATVCSRTTAQFNYEVDLDGAALETDDYQCEAVVETDYDLDYSIMRLSGSPGRTYGWYDLQNRDPSGNEQGIILQHPGGDRKEVALAPDCTLGDVASGNSTDTDFKHQCDTLSGSSGSPVMDEDFNVIGLHHFGGAGWLSRSSNQAVRMSRIMDQCDNCGGE